MVAITTSNLKNNDMSYQIVSGKMFEMTQSLVEFSCILKSFKRSKSAQPFCALTHASHFTYVPIHNLSHILLVGYKITFQEKLKLNFRFKDNNNVKSRLVAIWQIIFQKAENSHFTSTQTDMANHSSRKYLTSTSANSHFTRERPN